MNELVLAFLKELLQVIAAIGTAIIMRWLLELSTPQKDIAWLERQRWFQFLAKLHFYQGPDYLHQLKAKRLLRDFDGQ